MVDTEEPIDLARTARPQVGRVFKDRRELPGLALIVVSVLVLVGCLTAAAVLDTGLAIGLGSVALVAAVSGVGWVLVGRSRSAGAGKHRVQR